MRKQQGWPQAWEYSQAKLIQTLGRASQGVDWSWSQCIKSHHAQTSSGKGLPSHFWTRDNVRSILPGLWRKRTGLLLSGPKSSFQMKVNFAFHLETRSHSLEEEWRGTESKRSWHRSALLASKLAWPEPHRESMGYCQEEDERHQTQQCRWAEGHCQRNPGFHSTSAVPQTDHLHATPNWSSN